MHNKFKWHLSSSDWPLSTLCDTWTCSPDWRVTNRPQQVRQSVREHIRAVHSQSQSKLHNSLECEFEVFESWQWPAERAGCKMQESVKHTQSGKDYSVVVMLERLSGCCLKVTIATHTIVHKLCTHWMCLLWVVWSCGEKVLSRRNRQQTAVINHSSSQPTQLYV